MNDETIDIRCYDCEHYYMCVELDVEQNDNYEHWLHGGKNCPDYKHKN